ncbi:MAG TPA: DUF2339 domain-containing protein, partial [Thermoanaerobaculia bacterium]
MDCLTAIVFVTAGAALLVGAVAHRHIRALERALAELRTELRALAARSRSPAVAAAPPPSPAGESPVAVEPSQPVVRPADVAAATVLSPPPSPLPPRLPVSPPSSPAAPRVSLEERLGARLPVWIGSIALALAGAFLVKYSFEQGWLSPAVRVAIGIAFGIAMLFGGEAMRRSSPRVSQGLSAAGVADLFACFLAGTTLYGLISPAAGFGLIALTAAVAVALSLRQGPMVALIGLLGGFVAPYLIHSGPPSARNLFGYLLLLEVGFLVASRRRGWTAIAGLANAGGLLWVVAWIAGPFQGADGVWLCLFLVLLAAVTAATALAGRRPAEGRSPSPSAGELVLARGALGLGLAAISMVAGKAGYSTLEWAFFGVLAAGVLVLGLLDAEL